jgi:ArsR family transcriptional regulator
MIAVKQTQFDSINNRKTDASIVKLLGHPIRLKILTMLDMRECNVKHIWEYLGIEQAVVSQHLAVLKKLGIINGIRRGSEIFYTIVNPLVQRIIAVLNNEWKSL